MDDLIRRSDALIECEGLTPIECKAMKERIKSIPAVKPSEYADIAYGIGVCQGKASVESCEDAVSREWLLNELEEMNVANFYEANFHSNEMYGQMKRMLRDAPSVTAEPKHGEWVEVDHYWEGNKYMTIAECSACKEQEEIALELYKYCPNCGAKMKGAGNGQR